MTTKRKTKQETIRKLKGYPTVAEAVKMTNELTKKLKESLDKTKKASRKNAH